MRARAAALLALPLACAAPAQQVGDRFVLTRVIDTANSKSGESSGQSHDENALAERVVAIGPEGVEIEYDLPADATETEHEREWLLPARVLRLVNGAPRLTNRAELEKRLPEWLARFDLPRDACGRWGFSWTAYKIECDPDAALAAIAGWEIAPGPLRAGMPYRDGAAATAVPLVAGPGGVLTATAPLDIAAVRREEVETEFSVLQMMRKPVDRAAIERTAMAKAMAGTVTVTFVIDAGGVARRRVRVSTLEVRAPGEPVETRRMTETLERRSAGVRR